MENKEMQEFTSEVLNQTGLRAKLREKIPQIDRLESLDCLSDLTLTRIASEPVFMLWYEGTASSDLYPHVRSKLIKKEVISRHNALDSSKENEGQPNEYEEFRFGISGNSIQVNLRAYNPNYQR